MSSSEPKGPLGVSRPTSRHWTAWFIALVLGSLVAAGAIAVVQIKIDPFSAWPVKRRAGFNNNKPSQSVGRLVKPYQYARLEPDVVFLGNSRVGFGFPVRWPGVKDSKVFNFGLDDLQVEEAERTVDFMIATRPPKILVYGVDVLGFGDQKKTFASDFSEIRLTMLSLSRLTGWLWKLRETVLSADAIERAYKTVKASKLRPKQMLWDPHGYYQYQGEKKRPEIFRVQHYWWSYVSMRYKRWTMRPSGLEAFQRMVFKAKRAGIDLRVFFVPKSIEFMLCLDVNGKWPAFERLKRKIISVTPIWDFGDVNSVTRDRNNYLDGSHFFGRIGTRIIDRVAGQTKDKKSDFGVWVTKANVKQHVTKARAELEAFKTANPKMVKLMRLGQNRNNEHKFKAQVPSFFEENAQTDSTGAKTTEAEEIQTKRAVAPFKSTARKATFGRTRLH